MITMRRLGYALVGVLWAATVYAQQPHVDRLILNGTQQPTTGTGVLIHQDHSNDVTVPAAGTLSLIEISARQRATTLGTSHLYNLVLNTEADGIDNGAGLAIFNTGKADGIYVAAAGKSGAVSTNQPTGVGVDMNKGIAFGIGCGGCGGSGGSLLGYTENSSTYAGFGQQIWDWSTTSGNNAIALVLKKANNRNSTNILLQLEGNRRLIEMFTTESDGSYSATQAVIKLQDILGTAKWEVLADGTNEFVTRGKGIVWDMPSGNQPYLATSVATTTLNLRGGLSGFQILNQAESAANWAIDDAGAITLRSTTTIPNNKGIFWNPVSGNQGYIVQSSADQIDIRGGSSGFRILNNAGSVANLAMSDAGAFTFRIGAALDGGTPSTHGLVIPAATPGTTTSALYSPDGTTLYYNGGALGTSASVSGTTGTLAKFTSANAVGDSLITEGGSALTVTGSLDITDRLGLNSSVSNSYAILTVDRDGTRRNTLVDSVVNDNTGAHIILRKGRTGVTNPVAGDEVGGLYMQAYSDTTVFDLGSIGMSIAGSFTTGQRPPSLWDFYTNKANTAKALALRIQPSGALSLGTTTDPNQSYSSGGGGRVLIGAGSLAGSMPVLFSDDALRVQVASASTTDKLAGFFGMTSSQNQTGGPQALEAYTYMSQTGTTTLGIAGISNIEHGGTGTVTTMKAHTTTLLITSSGGGTDAIAFDANCVGRSGAGSGTFTNCYGLKVGSFGSGITNKYSVYSGDAGAKLYNAGPIDFGAGNFTVATTGNTVIAGTLVTGAITGTTGTFTGNVVPGANDTYNHGAAGNRWLNGYYAAININNGAGLNVPNMDSTTGTAVVWNADGALHKLTSSRRYKTVDEFGTAFAPSDHALDMYLALRAKPWDYLGQHDGAYGFIAEDLAALPLVNQYGYSPLVNYDALGRPDSNRDFALIAMEHEVNARQEARIHALEAKQVVTKHWLGASFLQ